MTELLLWFLVSQTFAGLPAMDPGTEVRVVSPDLLTVHATGRVVAGRLAFETELPGNLEVRLLVFPADANRSEVAETLAGATALRARVAQDGRDLLIFLPDTEGVLSLRKWLEEERGLALVIGDEVLE